MEILKQINRQIQPIRRQCMRLISIGKVLESSFNGSEITSKVAIFDGYIAQKCRVLSVNGLQKAPKKGDLALVLCPDGDPDQAIVLALLDTKKFVDSDQVALIQNEISMGKLLSQLIEILQTISGSGYFTSPTGPVVPKDPSVAMKLNELKSQIKRFA